MSTSIFRQMGSVVANTVDTKINTQVGALVDAQMVNKESIANKGVANGYAGLDATGRVPTAQLPAQTNLDLSAVAQDIVPNLDNILELNSNFTSGTPTENAGITVSRGDASHVCII